MNALNVARSILRCYPSKAVVKIQASCLHTTLCNKSKELFEPDYLACFEPKIPLYPTVNVVMQGYDFAVLEKFQSLTHTLVLTLGLDVTEGWAVRAKSLRVTKLKPQTSVIDTEFQMKQYQRVLQIDGVPSTTMSILIEMLEESAPPGVTCSIVEHTEEMEADRYVPDLLVRDLKKELDDMGGPSRLALKKGKK